MNKSCQKAFRAKYVFKMCVATPVFIISISAAGSTRRPVEVRCASGVQKAIVQFISQFEEYFTKEIGNSSESVFC